VPNDGGRPVILTACDYYLPGYKAGGPIRTLAAIVKYLSDEFRFRVVTRDRDAGDSAPYAHISAGEWHPADGGDVMYLAPGRVNLSGMRRLICSTDHHVLYINSWFSVHFAIGLLLMRRFHLIPQRPTIVAPRGELSPGALALKAGRKRLYIVVAKLLGLAHDVVWHASGEFEAQEIRRCFGERANVMVARDLAVVPEIASAPRVEKKPGDLRLLFLSRVSPMKNLDGAIRLLHGVEGNVLLSIYGPVEDTGYWSRCKKLAAQLTPNVKVEYGGVVQPERVGALMAQHDLFFLPTLGENFGHVILESLVSGCPVLISDRTYWRGLEAAGVGWDVPLEQPETFGNILRRCIAMDSESWSALSDRARKYGVERLNDIEAREQNRALFRAAYAGQSAPVQHVSNQAG
jgi:glycosyltransferase involved in cell wall biosynthesis